MRRKDREITDYAKINDIILKCKICRIGFNDNGKIYIVPLILGFETKDNQRILYFHSATNGKKLT